MSSVEEEKEISEEVMNDKNEQHCSICYEMMSDLRMKAL